MDKIVEILRKTVSDRQAGKFPEMPYDRIADEIRAEIDKEYTEIKEKAWMYDDLCK
tara:strand:- start:28684 stop:28851 length:168 start_codon:yes stop_codon:yes gene_type:complete